MKITIIGAGNVGVSIAYSLILRQTVKEIILIDRNPDLLFARDLELGQSIAALNLDIKLVCTSEYKYFAQELEGKMGKAGMSFCKSIPT